MRNINIPIEDKLYKPLKKYKDDNNKRWIDLLTDHIFKDGKEKQ